MPEKIVTRKDFLKKLFRVLILAVISAIGLKLLLKGRLTVNDQCISNMVCSKCSIIDDCGHPRALGVKQFFKSENKKW